MLQYYAYLLLYIVAYIDDDSLMVGIAVITLGSHKLTEQSGRVLKLISGGVMLTLAVGMFTPRVADVIAPPPCLRHALPYLVFCSLFKIHTTAMLLGLLCCFLTGDKLRSKIF